MKSIVISQPRYLPALNYIQRLCFADEFIILDTVQRQSRGLENRNKIITSCGSEWLTIPINSPSRQPILSTEISGTKWIRSHYDRIHLSYKDAPYYDRQLVRSYYTAIENALDKSLLFATAICATFEYLGELFDFTPTLRFASEIEGPEAPKSGPSKLAYLAQEVDTHRYISGPNGKDYCVEEAFAQTGIEVAYHHFDFNVFDQEPNRPILSFWDPLFILGKSRICEILKEPPTIHEAYKH